MGQKNLAIIYQNFADSGQISGGAWRDATLPLVNLQTPYLAQVARSRTTAKEDTQFSITFAGLRLIGGVAFGPCNVRPTAQARYRGYDGDELKFDSGWLPFPNSSVPSADLEYGDLGFWEQRDSEVDDLTKGITFIDVPDVPLAVRTLVFEISDEGNPDTYIDVGRLICGRVWRPKHNYDYSDNSLDLSALTDVQESRKGVRFYDPRVVRRSFSFGFSYLPDAETFEEVYRLATRSALHNQVVVVPNPGDPTTFIREAFIGTLAQLPSLRRPTFGYAATSFKIEEAL